MAKNYVHPFNEGYNAKEIGIDEYNCPYQKNDWRHDAWLDGWEHAEEDTKNEGLKTTIANLRLGF